LFFYRPLECEATLFPHNLGNKQPQRIRGRHPTLCGTTQLPLALFAKAEWASGGFSFFALYPLKVPELPELFLGSVAFYRLGRPIAMVLQLQMLLPKQHG
jgi:hypothetical protein